MTSSSSPSSGRTAGVVRRTAPSRANLVFWLFVAAHIVVWTSVPALTRGNLDRWGDMLENFVWGQEWQWGYHNHPPFFAWVSALWLELTATSAWSYFLLSQLNVAAGLLAVRAIAREYLSPAQAVFAAMLLELVPAYTFLSFKFNANTILLSLWPLTALFALYAVRRGGSRHWFLFGLFAACALLSKYYSALLLISIGVAFAFSPDGRRCLRSSGPYVAMLTCLALLSPHVVWLVQGDFPPVRYALSHVGDDGAGGRVAKFTVMNLLYIAPLVAAVLVLAARLRPRWRVDSLASGSFESWFLPVVCLGPFVLTIACGLVLHVKLSSVWGIPLWFLSSVFLLKLYGTRISRARWRLAAGSVMFLVVAMPAVALGVVAVSPAIKSIYGFPGKALAAQITSRWEREFARPLALVGGSKRCAFSVAFHSPHHPSVLIGFDYERSPWLSPERIRADGIAIVCEGRDTSCQKQARSMFPRAHEAGEFAVAASSGVFHHRQTQSFTYLFVPPSPR